MPVFRPLLVLAALAAGLAAADPVPLAGAGDTGSWRFNNGQEFKGATGGLEKADGGIALKYDFSAGGAYVAADWKAGGIPAGTTRIRFTATADADTVMKFRLITEDGRCFQGFERRLTAKTAEQVVIDYTGPWTQAWGGPEAKTPAAAAKGFSILATKKGSKSGTVVISALSTETK